MASIPSETDSSTKLPKKTRYVPENERLKYRYVEWLKEAEGKNEKTCDKVVSALRRFEDLIGNKPFSRFHVDWAKTYKRGLGRAKNARTGTSLSLATIDGELRITRAFFQWLAGQRGFKSRISYADVAYFNNNKKDARAAHASRETRYPSHQQLRHAFNLMPGGSIVERRNKAIFAFLVLTGARDGAIASFRLKHIDLSAGSVFQDGRDVATKNSKTFTTWFFPMGHEFLNCFSQWVHYLRDIEMFGPADPLFPKQKQIHSDGAFSYNTLSRETYSNPNKIRQVIGDAFETAGLERFGPHSFRNTLALYGDEISENREVFKAWSMNLGHEHMATTISSYMPVSVQRQGEIIRGLKVK
jgi:integrase/recombinase XerC